MQEKTSYSYFTEYGLFHYKPSEFRVLLGLFTLYLVLLLLSVYYCTYNPSTLYTLILHLYLSAHHSTARTHTLLLCESHRHTSKSPSRNQARLAPTIQSNLHFPRRSDLYSFDCFVNYASAGLAYLLDCHGGARIELEKSWILSLD
jgi:hypothetical protein